MTTITTYTGLKVNPLQPQYHQININDIAHALSYICRGNGHTSTFFSVAQHCINCAKEAKERGYSNKIILACLLHDASEAYICDIPKPLKQEIKDYQTIENNLLNIIYHKYLPSPLSNEEIKQIKDIDNTMLYYDLTYLLKKQLKEPKPNIHIQLDYSFIPFHIIEKEYLNLFYHYSK